MNDTSVRTTDLLKTYAQQGIRTFHRAFCSRQLPAKIGIYFHSIEENEYPAFQEAMRYFSDAGYRFAEPDSFLTRDDKCVYVSFDDNYRTWYDALPLLTSLNVTATFFTNTCCFRDTASPSAIDDYYDRLCWTGERVPLSTSELQEISEAGHRIGAHTHSHFCLTDLSFQQARDEILRSKTELQQILGTEIRDFSYPFGMRRHFSEKLRRWCLSAGFLTVSNALPGLQYVRQKPESLNRTAWDLSMPLDYNLDNLRINGRIFAAVTGRSVVG